MKTQEIDGMLIKAISGEYYVKADLDGAMYDCKAKGIFRLENQSPMVGDRVTLEVTEEGSGIISKIMPRKNELTRPSLSNLDKLFIVASVLEPKPSLLVIDKLITVCEYKSIEPVLIITKTDLSTPEEFEKIYSEAGFKVFTLSNLNHDLLEEVKDYLRGGISGFAGNTGVGKSSLINNLCPSLSLETAHISKKLGRGRHTTRHVELYYLKELDCYLADTPGFGAMEMLQYEIIRKEELAPCFREFWPYAGECKFTGCSHTVEKGCAVLKALEEGKISKERHESYMNMYKEAEQIKEWDLPGKKQESGRTQRPNHSKS